MQLSAQVGMLEVLPQKHREARWEEIKGNGSWPALKITFSADKGNSQKWAED